MKDLRLIIIAQKRMNGTRIYFSDQHLNDDQVPAIEGTIIHFQKQFRQFIQNFSRENVREYNRAITSAIQNDRYIITLALDHLKSYDEGLYAKFADSPQEMLVVMESALRDYVKEKQGEFPAVKVNANWQIAVKSDQNPKRLREIGSTLVNKMFVVSGIIISCTKPYIKASILKIQCRNCESIKEIKLAPGQFPYVPSYCPGREVNGVKEKCSKDPFIALPSSEVIDLQSLKIQENTQQIPTGEIARTYSMIADRYNVSKCVPGDRVRITGVMNVHELPNSGNNGNITRGYIYITGITKLKDRTSVQYSQQQEELFKKMGKDPKIYQKVHRSIAPGIYGNQEIKKAIACMLIGGSRKHLPDNTILRGDINILLLGDPSTAKSQFLKFVELTAAIAVYTSGKGSSAAGLTASITKDSTTGEFQIEGGALVLADGGVVCIDQFDKMKSGDRVAIHEAMEQQTISVAKAGITTRLNSRASVLAAANPIKGRCDDYQHITEQIELQSTILSRFDCIFVVKDINTEESNTRLANHILDLHQGKIAKLETDIPFQILKKFINYTRHHNNPRLSVGASQKLQAIYIADRQKSREQRKMIKNGIPITVRQLEAIIRLSEALAKLRFRKDVSQEDVDEAHYLFEVSTMKTIEGGDLGTVIPENVVEEVMIIEESIKKKVCVGNQVPIQKLVEDLEGKFSAAMVNMAIHNLVQNQEMRQVRANKFLIRDK